MNRIASRNANKTVILAVIAAAVFLIFLQGSPVQAKHPVLQDSGKSQKFFGGKFSLVDHTGRPVTEKDFRGKILLVYFGYTNCPDGDRCPIALQVMSNTMDILGEAGNKVQPLFFTFDPKRDNPKVMARYLANFHPGILGLTGKPEQTLIAANIYGVDVVETYNAGETSGYKMNHSAFIYVKGVDGRMRFMFRPGITGEAIAGKLRKLLNENGSSSGN